MLYMMLVFGHLLATSMALGAIVATDVRMLSKLARNRLRIPPPNEFVARLVMIALLLLYATGGAMIWIGSNEHADFINPKLQGKLVLVLLLSINALVLHRITFPRLARGRSLDRWRVRDWVAIVVPVSLSNCLWMFCAFLGIARPWNHSMPMAEILEIAATLYVLALFGVGTVLAAAGRQNAHGTVTLRKRARRSTAPHGNERDGAADPSLQLSRPTRAQRAVQTPRAAIRDSWLGNLPTHQA